MGGNRTAKTATRGKKIESKSALRYFYGSNGENGYRSETDEFSENTLNRLYIIKGGSGTGKSTFMRECAASAEKIGAECVYYFCGSDPDSVDGVIIRRGNISVGIIDGTSPHTADPVYPGAIGRILDFGRFWDAGMLEARKNEIRSITGAKSGCFTSAYKYLRGAAALRAEISHMADSFTDIKKMNAAAERIAKNFYSGNNTVSRCIEGITMRGAVTLDTFEFYENRYAVSDVYGSGRLFMRAMSQALHKSGAGHIILRDPLSSDGITSIAIPEKNAYFYLCNPQCETESKRINMQRFILRKSAAECRGRRRLAEKCFNSLKEGACSALIEASQYHFALEEIYKSAMDFQAVTNLRQEISAEIAELLEK